MTEQIRKKNNIWVRSREKISNSQNPEVLIVLYRRSIGQFLTTAEISATYGKVGLIQIA